MYTNLHRAAHNGRVKDVRAALSNGGNEDEDEDVEERNFALLQAAA